MLREILLAPGAIAIHELVNDFVDKLFFITCTLGKQRGNRIAIFVAQCDNEPCDISFL